MITFKSLRGIFSLIVALFCVLFFVVPSNAALSENERMANACQEALIESREGEFKEALDLWNRCLKSDPENAIALSNRGIVRLALGDAEGSIADQTSAIELLPHENEPYLNRGTAEEVLERWEEAETDYKFILENEPNNSAALYNLGNISMSQGQWLQAQNYFELALRSRPDFVMARSSHALVQYQIGELDNSEQELRNLIRHHPMMADSRAALSALLWRKGSLGEARSHWSAASGLDNRYSQRNWLSNVRRWPSQPIDDLFSLLASS